MRVRTSGKLDVLEKESGENIIAFSDAVRRYQQNSSCTAREFCKAVSVSDVTLEEAATIYGDVHRTEGSRVILFQGNKRYPVWSEEGGIVS